MLNVKSKIVETKDRVVGHVKEYKEAYIVGAVGTVAVVTAVVITKRVCSAVNIIDTAPIDAANAIGDIAGDVNAPIVQTVNIIKHYAERGCHPGKKIYIKELNKVARSIAEASAMTGVSRGSISNCIRGVRDSVGGFTYTFVGDADAPFA